METEKKHVPIEKFGKDHWSTFAYAECRIVDNDGLPDLNHMRCDIDRHPGLGRARWGGGDRKKYPTILRGGEKLDDHDDWDCIDDLVAAGLLTIHGTGIHPVWAMTEKGWQVAALLRQHKAKGKNFSEFHYTGEGV